MCSGSSTAMRHRGELRLPVPQRGDRVAQVDRRNRASTRSAAATPRGRRGRHRSRTRPRLPARRRWRRRPPTPPAPPPIGVEPRRRPVVVEPGRSEVHASGPPRVGSSVRIACIVGANTSPTRGVVRPPDRPSRTSSWWRARCIFPTERGASNPLFRTVRVDGRPQRRERSRPQHDERTAPVQNMVSQR